MSGENKFGVNTWWYVPVCVIDGEAARKAVVEGGFDEGLLPKPTKHAEVSRAARSVASRRKKADKSIAEKVKDDNNLVYGILDYDSKGEQAEYAQSTTVRMDKKTGAVTCEGDKADKVMAAVQAYKGKITDADVRTFLVNVVAACHGVSKRHGGGIYFIPAPYVERIQAAQKVLSGLGCGARIYVERVVDGKQERQNVWEACQDNIEQQIKETVEAVERIEKRASSIADKQVKLEELDEMMGVYWEILGEEAKYEELKERIGEAAKVVADKMVKMQQGTAASAVPKAAKAPAAPKAAKADAGDKIPVVDAAAAVLRKAGKPLASRELYDQAVAEGWYVSSASDPYTSFLSVLSKALSKGEKRIVKVSQGVWAVAA